MERKYEHEPAVERLSNLSDYEVSGDSPDVRGWTVNAADGRSIGRVTDLLVDTNAMKARYLLIDTDSDAPGITPGEGREIAVPAERAALDEGSHTVKAPITGERLAGLPRYASGTPLPADYAAAFGPAEPRGSGEQRVTRSGEELRIGKRTVPAGEVRVRKDVESRHVEQPVTRYREEPEIRREAATGHGGSARIHEDEVRIPLTEEEVVVEKRPVTKEEIVVGKKRVPETERVETDVKEERVHIEGDAKPGEPRRRRT